MSDEKPLIEKLDEFMMAHGFTDPGEGSPSETGIIGSLYYGMPEAGPDSLMDVNFLTEAFEIIEGTEEAVDGITKAAEAPTGGTRMDSSLGIAYKKAVKDHGAGKGEDPGTFTEYLRAKKDKARERPVALSKLILSVAMAAAKWHEVTSPHGDNVEVSQEQVEEAIIALMEDG